MHDLPVAVHHAPDTAGIGRLTLRLHGSEAVFVELSAAYPLKLLSPRIARDRIAVAYMLTYGGGLVGGDRVTLFVDIGPRSNLMLLTQVRTERVDRVVQNELVVVQGSTKVFKARLGGRKSVRGHASTSATDQSTQQRMDVNIADGGALFLLPDPVTCFRAASFHQIQTFRLSAGASLVLLDWITSGRRSLGEEWVFSRYYSINEVYVDSTRIARDALLLDGEPANPDPLPRRSLKDRLAPYSCYATIMLYGPLTEGIVCELDAEYEKISVYKLHTTLDLIWSLSPISGNSGRMVRVAGKETEDVKAWLRSALRGVESIVGIDMYRKAFT